MDTETLNKAKSIENDILWLEKNIYASKILIKSHDILIVTSATNDYKFYIPDNVRAEVLELVKHSYEITLNGLKKQLEEL